MRILGMTPPELLVIAGVCLVPAIVFCLIVYVVVRLAVRHELARSRKDDGAGE